MDIVQAFTGVLGEVGKWLITFIQQVLPLFWVEGAGETAGHLTFFGVMAVIGLAISVFFLIMRLIENFIHLRS